MQKKVSMKKSILIISSIALFFACKQTSKNETKPTHNIPVVTHSSQMVDDIQVNTIQIGGDSTKEKNNFQASYPQTKHEFINAIEKQDALKLQQEFEEEIKKVTKDAVAGVTFGKHFEVLENSKNLIGFLNETYRSFGNTFSDEYQTNYYDVTNKKLLTINNLFTSEKAFSTFASKITLATKETLKKIIEKDASLTQTDKQNMLNSLVEQINNGTAAAVKNYNAVVFKPEVVEVIFNKYQVAPGSMGSIKVQIASKDITELLKEEYQTLFRLEKKPEEVKNLPKKETTTTQIPTSDVNCDEVPCVALTFDDGPSVHTNRLLDILKEEEVKATFFVLGKSSKVQPNTILRQQKEGHVVANHSWNHKDLRKLSTNEVVEQINNTNQAIEEVTNTKVKYLRPPYGAFNTEIKSVSKMPIILWTIDPLDWKDRNAETVAERMMKAKANGIILAHDIHKSTVDAVPNVIKTLKEKGFYFVSLDELYAGKKLENGKVYNSRKTN